jgi:hypothetical protein
MGAGGSAAVEPLESRIAGVGRDLALAFTDVLGALPGGPHRPQRLAESLGVNTVLTSRLLKAAQQADPIAVAHRMPGPEPLRRLLKAAEKKRIDPALLDAARAAVDRFEHLIRTEAGDRGALDAIISGWLPDAREKVEMLARQAVYRGMSQLLGSVSEIEHHTVFLVPSADTPHVADMVWVVESRGFRRVRPGITAKYHTVHAAPPILTLDGNPVDALDGLLLERFCSQPPPSLEVAHFGDRTQYDVAGEEVGLRSAIDLVHATFLPRRKELFRAPADLRSKTALTVGIAIPTRTLIFDVLLPSDLYREQQPALFISRGTIGDGVPRPGDPSFETNRLEVMAVVQPLGQGLSKFRTAEVPDRLELLQHVCERRGWDGRRLRGYRCRMDFPVYGSQITLAFEAPPLEEG